MSRAGENKPSRPTVCIVDLKHTQVVSAGETPGGLLRHVALHHGANALWVLEACADGKGFYIRDRLHGRCIVAPDEYDGRLYHEDALGRANARWQIFPMYDGAGGGNAVTIKDGKFGLAGRARRISLP
jgi:hypothetical protein